MVPARSSARGSSLSGDRRGPGSPTDVTDSVGGVTDTVPDLEIQDHFTLSVAELRALSTSTLPRYFGETVAEPV